MMQEGKQKMKFYAFYFSPTGNCKKVASIVAKEFNNSEVIDITPQEARTKEYSIDKEDILFVVAPTYAGKLPNKILPELKNMFKTNGAKAIAVTLFGNRSFDNSLAELVSVLKDSNFSVIGAAALTSEHAFSNKLANGRPNTDDLAKLCSYVKERVSDNKEVTPIGDASAPYYTPLGLDEKPAMFLKAKPKTKDACVKCGACVKACPVNSIEKDCVTVLGPCIKCQACIKVCPVGAKYLDDEAFLSHVSYLENHYGTGIRENYYAK